MSKKDFLSEIQRLKQARINLVAAKMEQILLQELALACVNKIQLKGTLNKEFSTNIKQWLPAKITDKVEGIPLREWEQSARVRTTVGGGARRRNRDEDDYDYDYDRSPKPAGLLGVLLGTGGTATTAYFLYNYLSNEDNREKVAQALGFAHKKIAAAVGVDDLKIANKTLTELLIEANKKLAEFADMYKQKPTTSSSSSPETKSEIVPVITPETNANDIVKAQFKYMSNLDIIINEYRKFLKAQSDATKENEKGIDFYYVTNKYNEKHLFEASILLPSDEGSPPKTLTVDGRNVTVGDLVQNVFNQRMIQQFQQYWEHMKQTPAYLMLVGVLNGIWNTFKGEFFRTAQLDTEWRLFEEQSTNFLKDFPQAVQPAFAAEYNKQKQSTHDILRLMHTAPDGTNLVTEMEKRDVVDIIMLAAFIMNAVVLKKNNN